MVRVACVFFARHLSLLDVPTFPQPLNMAPIYFCVQQQYYSLHASSRACLLTCMLTYRYTGLENRNMPLDITNPEVIQWQLETYAAPAASAGYTVIAADMFYTSNIFKACGVWESKGSWKQVYSTAPPPPPPPPPGPLPSCMPPLKTTGCPCWWNTTDATCACCNVAAKCCESSSKGSSPAEKETCARCSSDAEQQQQQQQQQRGEDGRRGGGDGGGEDGCVGEGSGEGSGSCVDFAAAQVGWLSQFRAGLKRLQTSWGQ